MKKMSLVCIILYIAAAVAAAAADVQVIEGEHLQSTIKDLIQQEIGNFKDEILETISMKLNSMEEKIDSIGSKLNIEMKHSDSTKEIIGEAIGVIGNPKIKDGVTVMLYNSATEGHAFSKLLGYQQTNIIEEEFEKIYPCKALQKNVHINLQCIKLQTYLFYSWEDHHQRCLHIGGKGLLEVTKERLPLLQHYLKTINDILKRHPLKDRYGRKSAKEFVVWIGGQRKEEGRFKWPSGRDVSMSWGWSDGEPRHTTGNNNCLTISDLGEGTFNETDCNEFIEHSFCEMFPPTDEISSKDLEITVNSVKIEEEFERTSCGGEYNSSMGYITHPLFDPWSGPESGQKYQNNEHCIWIIRGDSARTMNITIVGYNIEEGADYVSVRDGESINSNVLGNFTGYWEHVFFQTSTNVARVVFTSDGSGIGGTFRMFWYPSFCGGEYTSSSGMISYPDCPDCESYNYPGLCPRCEIYNFENCTWIIRASGPITITFVRMELEENEHNLSVRDGDSIGSHVLGTFSGTIVPSPIQTSTNAAYLVFTQENERSNNITSTGFQFYWELSDTITYGELEEEGAILPPEY